MRVNLLRVMFRASLSLISTVAIGQLATPSAAAPPRAPTAAIVLAQQPTSASITEETPRFAQWVLAIAILAGVISLTIGIVRYNRNEKWYRIEFLRKAVREFEDDPDIRRALRILDFEEYRDYAVSLPNHDKPVAFQVTNELLCAALGNHKERIQRKQAIDTLKAKGMLTEEILDEYQIETVLRDWFNKMLNGLEHFGYFVESELFTANEIRPWMIYWIRLIADRAYKRPGASKFYDQLYSYTHDYGFSGVIKLFEQFGYRILPTPYKETDFADLSGGLQKFDLQTALTLAKAAYLTYEDKSYVREICQRWGIADDNSLRYFNSRVQDTQAFMLKTNDFIVLAFRGSQELKDWQTNFSTRLKRFNLGTTMEPLQEDMIPPRGQVHRGFQTAWESVEGNVIRQLQKWKQEQSGDLPLFITGHSLGGALATVAAASLTKQKFIVQGLYTFGQPRVGDLVFAAEMRLMLDGKIFRFVNNNDIVPHIPPPYLPWNPFRLYVHVGQRIYFDFRGNMYPHPNPILRFVDFLVGLLRDAVEPGFDAINDHRMEYYVSNLRKALELELERKRLEAEETTG